MSNNKIQLQDLSNKLGKGIINDKIIIPNRKAMMSFEYGGTKASSYQGFLKEAARYVQHQAKSTSKIELSDEDALSKAEEYLDAAFQQEGGVRGAYKIARDDLVSVIQRVGNEIEGQESMRHRKGVFSKVDPYDFDAQVELANQYLDITSKLAGKVDARRPEDLARDWKQLASTYANIADAARESVEYMGPSRRVA